MGIFASHQTPLSPWGLAFHEVVGRTWELPWIDALRE